ncbi:MAG: class I SAM-dependent methyltransferase [Candidatus Altiarchaeota archaeon]|nr:class I SAM-dependent methyltransferase [Candidatus Altiarchaeota archaeon]
MSKLKALMFNRKASNPKSRPDEILNALALQPGQNIADIGAGGGYFTLRFADAVGGGGRVYAVDTNPEFLEFIRDNAKEKGLSNVETIHATGNTLNLPEKSSDLVFMRNVYHHLSNRTEYFRNLRGALKPGGKVVVIDYKNQGFFSFRRFFGHHTPKETIMDELNDAGYDLMQEHDILPEQHFLVYTL